MFEIRIINGEIFFEILESLELVVEMVKVVESISGDVFEGDLN